MEVLRVVGLPLATVFLLSGCGSDPSSALTSSASATDQRGTAGTSDALRSYLTSIKPLRYDISVDELVSVTVMIAAEMETGEIRGDAAVLDKYLHEYRRDVKRLTNAVPPAGLEDAHHQLLRTLRTHISALARMRQSLRSHDVRAIGNWNNLRFGSVQTVDGWEAKVRALADRQGIEAPKWLDDVGVPTS